MLHSYGVYFAYVGIICWYRELSRLGYNFINTKRVVCVQGQYPDILLEKWDNYPNSENDRPGRQEGHLTDGRMLM